MAKALVSTLTRIVSATHSVLACCRPVCLSEAVASYIGDTEEIVRKHYAKFCIAEQVEAAKSLSHALSKQASGLIYAAANPRLIASARNER